MGAFLKFNQGVMKMSLPWRFWVIVVVGANVAVPLFFLGSTEAQIVLLAYVASTAVMTLLTGLTGFTRLLGIGHVFWIPMIIWLWIRLDQIPSDDAFGVWIRVLIALNTVCLLIDAVDLVRYLAGEREEKA